MENFIYTNPRGKKIELNYDGDYLIDSYDGLTNAAIEPITIKGYRQNGYTLNGLTYGSRLINITFYLCGRNAEDLYKKRAELSSVFNPLLGEGLLTYTNDYTSKSIRCIPSVAPTINDRTGLLLSVAVELTAHNPFWFDTAESALLLEGFTGGLKFPIKFSPSQKFANKDTVAVVRIEGDIPSPIRAEFRGASLKPRLTLTNTGEFIEVDKEMSAGEKMIITTEYGNKNVIYENANGDHSSAYHLINLDSTFFSLPYGENTISFTSQLGEPQVYIYWRNYYAGV